MSTLLLKPCEKCGSNAAPRTEYRGSFYGESLYAPWAPCWFGRCPNDEHLHRWCATCGVQWIEPVRGKALAAPRERPEHKPKFWRMWLHDLRRAVDIQ